MADDHLLLGEREERYFRLEATVSFSTCSGAGMCLVFSGRRSIGVALLCLCKLKGNGGAFDIQDPLGYDEFFLYYHQSRNTPIKVIDSTALSILEFMSGQLVLYFVLLKPITALEVYVRYSVSFYIVLRIVCLWIECPQVMGNVGKLPN